ncbi:MAG: glutathione S-transferase N-terminal domain-containing protein [Deltaproteobacteria bacterium]|nr:glutathione S-transferase N-terminal domain-containing protein [Deltaproteobacteria bacterium]MBW2161418.1 glutathione S-transferase N-terminal domain-containing protein [Deltaproteobacteria bacterium]
MLTLYDNPFSPFARKVRMVLGFKGLEFESIDALALNEHDRLAVQSFPARSRQPGRRSL